ncbi:unnamed protein product [Phytophthora lilii]|uniref:Unnamed protein product n=1 Tax=Phytophthora lilii TaxID=2077276 RepID=A0A9W7CIC4_9STRA|nr:unnamed protein product [Phytophthora lilii]
MQLLLRLLLLTVAVSISATTASAVISNEVASDKLATSDHVSLVGGLNSGVSTGAQRALRGNGQMIDPNEEERGISEWIGTLGARTKAAARRGIVNKYLDHFGKFKTVDDSFLMGLFKEKITPDDLRAKALEMTNEENRVTTVRIISVYEPWFKAVVDGKIKVKAQ